MKPLHVRRVLALVMLAALAFVSRTDAAQGPPESTLREAWVGTLEVGPVQAVMQLRIVEDGDGGTRAFFDSVTEKRTNFDATWSVKDGELSFDVAKVKATYRGRLNTAGDTAEGRFEQGGRSLALTLRRQAAAYDNVNVWEKRPQRPKAPFPYDSEDVTFANEKDGVTLAGTLTLPRGNGKRPAVILISGSGPQDRDETLMEHKPFLVLADELGRRGVAVLRYDDRGTAQSTGEFEGATTEDFARDATAALEFLRHHERIDAHRIGLLGHSEGGLIAPMVAAARADVAFVVLLAAPGVPMEELSHSQAAAMTRAAGGGDAEVRLTKLLLDEVFQVVKRAPTGVDVRGDIAKALADAVARVPETERELATKRRAVLAPFLPTYATPWFRFLLMHDPTPALRKLRCPVLALNGSKDLQVLSAENLPAIEAALTTGKDADFEIVELAGLNHMFQECETGAMREYLTLQETFHPPALKRIGDWITSRALATR